MPCRPKLTSCTPSHSTVKPREPRVQSALYGTLNPGYAGSLRRTGKDLDVFGWWVHNDPMNRQKLLKLASNQAGYVRSDQVVELAGSRSWMRHALSSGELERVSSSVYRLFVSDHIDALLRGAVLALPDAVVSHHSAARLHGLLRWEEDGQTPVVTVHARTTHVFPGVDVRRSLDLDEDMVLRLNHLPVTTVERTIFDLAAFVPTRQLDDLIEKAVLDKRATIDKLNSIAKRLARRGRRGTVPFREAMERRGNGVVASLSVLERRALELVRQSWLPEPILQFRPPWASSMHFDAAYPVQRVALEWDSRLWHLQQDRFQADRRRDRLAATHGWVVLRFTWEDIRERPDSVLRQIGEVLIGRGLRDEAG